MYGLSVKFQITTYSCCCLAEQFFRSQSEYDAHCYVLKLKLKQKPRKGVWREEYSVVNKFGQVWDRKAIITLTSITKNLYW